MVTLATWCCSLPGGGTADRERLDTAGIAGVSSGRGRLGEGSECVRHQSQGN